MANDQAVLVAVLLAPHGIAGDLLAESYSDYAGRFVAGGHLFDEKGTPYEIIAARPHKGRLLLRLQGVDSREAAERLRGCKLFIRPEEAGPLPEGCYYHFQIVGLRVEEDGRLLGVVREVLSYRANDIYRVETPEGGELLLPALKSVVRRIDISAGVMQVVLPEGLSSC